MKELHELYDGLRKKTRDKIKSGEFEVRRYRESKIDTFDTEVTIDVEGITLDILLSSKGNGTQVLMPTHDRVMRIIRFEEKSDLVSSLMERLKDEKIQDDPFAINTSDEDIYDF